MRSSGSSRDSVSTKGHIIEIRGIPVEVAKKDIKNLHVGVYPPDGHVRVAAPRRLKDDAIRLAVVTRIGWIRRQQARFHRQERQTRREMVSGESHYLAGRRYRLRIIERDVAPEVRLRKRTLEIVARPGSDRARREEILHAYYRKRLHDALPLLIAAWEPLLGVKVSDWRVKRMKTRWGSCNAAARRIWVNLELAKKPAGCLEYIVVHEMLHLLERHHNDNFKDRMQRLLPNWRRYRDELNQSPLAHYDWRY